VELDEVGELADLEILGLAIAQVGNQLVEGELESVTLLQLFPEHNCVDRSHSEIVEEAGPAVDLAKVFSAGEVPQDADEVIQD
jgi:hypothetical protein